MPSLVGEGAGAGTSAEAKAVAVGKAVAKMRQMAATNAIEALDITSIVVVWVRRIGGR